MRITTRLGVSATAMILALHSHGSPAFAHDAEMADGQTVTAEHRPISLIPQGLAIQAGGGVTGFSRQATRDMFGTGGYWDVRGIFGTSSYLGAEVAYVGTARDATAVGLTGSPALVSNGAEVAARGNLPIQLRDNLRVEPFVFGGLGWSYFQLANADSNRSNIKDHANALTIPFGAGGSLTYNHLLVDARFTYRAVFDDKLVPMTGGDRDHADLQNWSAGLTVGYQL
jgi:hypothetical protein